MLEVNRVSRSYGDFKAVDDVSFSIGTGEIVGLLGHNGAGKTTVMKMLSGYLEPDNGSIAFDGRDLQSNLKSVQAEVGYLPESLPLYPEMTILDYLDYAADLKRLPASAKRDELKRVIHATSLAEKINDPIATLSRGYKQRTGVAQAILGSPRLLILDEPTNGLDPAQTDQMRQLLKQISNSATVILSTHIMQEVDALCDRVLMMRSGQMAVDEQLASLQQSNKLLLSISHAPSQAEALLKSVAGVAAVKSLVTEAGAGSYDYLISLTDNADNRLVASQMVRALVDNGADVYALREQQRDIETLFREVNSAYWQQEKRHAA